ncbi:FG-GAP repeat domain-containing protein [Thermopirellula anaerolimosa]
MHDKKPFPPSCSAQSARAVASSWLRGIARPLSEPRSRMRFLGPLALSWFACSCVAVVATADEPAYDSWTLKSSRLGDFPPPNEGDQQTCLVVADFDGDSILDFAVGERTRSPGIVWYRSTGTTWERRVIEAGALRPEAGGVAADLDGDGDPDLILGQDASGTEMWWWENPDPHFEKPWKRRLIKVQGGRKHHDQTFGDFTGDGRPELLSWNQGAKSLLLFTPPDDPRVETPWSARVIYRWQDGPELEGFPSYPVDVDGDGVLDIVGGGRWLRYRGEDAFDCEIIDDRMRFTQCAAGQLVAGGRPEIVFLPGDTDGEARWYEFDGRGWQAHSLGDVVHGHTCEIGDLDGDDNLDILIGEMGSPGAGDQARILVWLGDGRGGFRKEIIRTGQGIHEGRLADVNGDGRLDILVKPYHHNAPLMEILLNGGRSRAK